MLKTGCKTSSRAVREDWISNIPDEILIMVLSRLGVKEAARTSVLSHRWKNLWKFYTGFFDFDALEKLLLVLRFKELPDVEAFKYATWVNQVLDSHQGYTIEGLKISFDLDNTYMSFIDRWIDFAICKSVRRLELDLSPSSGQSGQPSSDLDSSPMIYAFPTWLPSWHLGVSDFEALASLRLKSVDLTKEVLQYFLSNCLMLEQLCIDSAPSLCNLTIASKSLKLKHLEITNCLGLKNLHISARNLGFFKYWGPEINMLLEDVPNLSSVSLGGDYCWPLVDKSKTIALPFSLVQLEGLVLDIPMMVCERSFELLETFPAFTNLRQLELKFNGYSEHSILCLSSFVLASPSLEKLVLRYEFNQARAGTWHPTVWEGFVKFEEKRMQLISQHKHECLKEVEFFGWVGLKADFEFATYLIEAAVSLERITITPCHPYDLSDLGRWRSFIFPQSDEEKEAARARARQLEAKLLSCRTKLVVM